jgi:hypothetical protein
MIGRQFSYYCCPEDLDVIETKVIRPFGGRLLRIEKRDGSEKIIDEPHFSLPRERMGKETLSLLLAPPESMTHIQYESWWVDIELSHLIEIGRCYIQNGLIKPGRFWYVPKTYVERIRVDKPEQYLKWAQDACRKTKQLLTKHRHGDKNQYEDWFGETAWHEVSKGSLHASPN